MSPNSLRSDKHGNRTMHAGLQALTVTQLGSGNPVDVWRVSTNSDSEALIFPCSVAGGTKGNLPTYSSFHYDAHLLSNNPPLSALTGALMSDSTGSLSQGYNPGGLSHPHLLVSTLEWRSKAARERSKVRKPLKWRQVKRCRYYREIMSSVTEIVFCTTSWSNETALLFVAMKVALNGQEDAPGHCQSCCSLH